LISSKNFAVAAKSVAIDDITDYLFQTLLGHQIIHKGTVSGGDLIE
jgi:hypothetical protein